MILVLWTIGLTTLVVLSLQVSAYRQAAAGGDALGRVRAKWAARAGVERCIALIAYDAENAYREGPLWIETELAGIARGELNPGDGAPIATYTIQHAWEDELREGPADAHAKVNISLTNFDELMLLEEDEEMTQDVAEATLDGIDSNDEEREMGAEADTYLTFAEFPYEPRNGPFRSIQEWELILYAYPDLVRGEDWNLNGMLDPNENDGDLTWPDYDNADGILDAGWSRYYTASSRQSGIGLEGEPKIDLMEADLSEITRRLSVDSRQAEALIAYFDAENPFFNLLTTNLSEIAEDGTIATDENPSIGADDLDDEQLAEIFDEAIVGNPAVPRPGRLNLNTAPFETIMMLPAMGEDLAYEIEFQRDRSSDGLTSILDLLEIEGMSRSQLAQLAPYIVVRSSVYVVTARGVADPGRTEVELVVTIDRSTLPVKVIEYLER